MSNAGGNQVIQSRIKLLQTGITGFDDILGGGLPEAGLYLIQGLAGSGKTTLAGQIGFVQAKRGKKVLILTLIAESHAKMLNHFSNFSFFDESLIGEQVTFFSGYASLAKGGLRELLSLITTCLAQQEPGIFIVDGFRSVRNSSPSDLALSEFMHSLNALVASMGCTTFLISPVEGNISDSENTLVDGVIELSQYEQGMRLMREVKIFKVRGANHLLGKHVFEVKSEGIVIYPRFEAVATRANVAPAASNAYLSVGIPSWDAKIGGGVVRGSVTCLLGSPGVGKTLMGLHFIMEGLRKREQCLILGFYESPPSLVEKARRIGFDLSTSLGNGDLEIMWNLPLEALIDSVASRMFANIAERRVTRLFIDGVDGLRSIAMHPDRAPAFLTALVNGLRVHGVTTFLTEQLPYFKESIATANASASALYENIMLAEHVRGEDGNYRQLSVLKLRENDYDPGSCKMTISSTGISVGSAIVGAGDAAPATQPGQNDDGQ